MRKILCKILRQDPDTREGVIASTSALGVLVNLLIAAAKVILGLLAASIAIISEGVNNATDALNSVLALIGTKLAGKHPDKKHPFGYGRVEYLTSLVIAVLILVTGVEMIKDAIGLIIEPGELKISYISLIVVAASAVVKFCLGLYTIKMGKKADSGTLVAVGVDCRNDAFVSVVTILSAVIFLVKGWSIDAYVGVFTSLIILKAGFDILRDTTSALIGQSGEAELASELYKVIRSTPGVLNAADMMLHNYGPGSYSGSVNIEIDHEAVLGDIYQVIHELQLRIMTEYHVTMVFGMYAVDNDHEVVREIRKTVAEYVRGQEHVHSFHAIYLDPGNGKLYVDLVVDYELRDWDALERDFLAYMAGTLPDTQIELTIETEFV